MNKAIDKCFSSNNLTEYWIVFTEGHHWISWLLKKNFSHVYIITRDRYNWVVLDPRRLFLHFELPPIPISVDAPRLIAKPTDHIIKLTMYSRANEVQFSHFGLTNCVSRVLYLIGLRISVLTPLRLYRRLLKLKPREMSRLGIQSVKLIA